MKQMITLALLLFSIGALQSTSTYTLQSPSSEISFLIRSKLILVEGAVNGRVGYFLFDTGASELILNKERFSDGYNDKIRHQFADTGGHGVSQGSIFIGQFDWAGLKREKFFAPCLELGALEAELGEVLLGIIGYDVLRHVDIEVDYYRSAMAIRRPTGEKSSLPVRKPDYHFTFKMDGHIPILRASLGEAGNLRMGLDSGSSMNICDRALRKKIAGRALKKRSIRMQGPGGRTIRTDYYTLESLQVENAYAISYARVALNSLKAFRDYGIHLDGLLGVNFFRLGKVRLNYSSQTIDVWLEHNDYTLRHNSLALPKGMSAE